MPRTRVEMQAGIRFWREPAGSGFHPGNCEVPQYLGSPRLDKPKRADKGKEKIRR